MSKNEIIGAIVSSVLTWFFTHVFHVKKQAALRDSPDSPDSKKP